MSEQEKERVKQLLINEFGKGAFIPDIKAATILNGLDAALKNKPELDKVSALMRAEGSGISQQIRDTMTIELVRRWTQDKTFYDRMESALKADPQLSQAMLNAIKTNPNGLLNQIKRGDGVEAIMVSAKAAYAPPVAVSLPQTSTNAPTQSSAPQAPAPSAVGVSPVAAVAAPPPPSPPPAGGASGGFNLADLANISDEDIRKNMSPDVVKTLVAPTLAKIAKEQGVSPVIADAFVKRIQGDPKLAEAISEALKRNPSSIKAMAAAIQEAGGQDVSLSTRLKNHVIKSELTSLMNNPQKLASDDYLQSVERLTKQNDIFKALGFDKMFGGMFGGGGFSRFADQFACFTGPNKVFSICTSPGGFLPSIMINQGAMADNRIHALFRQFENPQDMKLLPNDGKLFLDKMEGGKPVLDKEGKPVQELNTVEIKLADGSTKKIVPANSPNYTAKQAQGGFSAGGEYIPGNIWVSVITGVDPKTQLPNRIDRVVMTPQQFEDYQKLIAKNSGGQEQIPFQSFTVADANKFRQDVAQATTQNTVRYDPATGQALPPVATPATGAQTFPVRPQTQIEDRRLETVT